MITPDSRRWREQVEYVVVERNGVSGDEQQDSIYGTSTPTPTIDQVLSQPYTKRQQPTPTDDGNDSDDDDDDFTRTSTTTGTPSSGFPPPVRTDREK
jgi:hypothetical protein